MSVPTGLSAQPAGETVAVKQSASASGSAGARVLQFRDPVFMGDMVTTDQVGLAQFRLVDDTKLVVGPNSQLAIDSFVLASPNSAREVTLNAVEGTFRFITGQSQKQAYTINTPVASIGVRGTEFDFTIEGDTVSMALYGGNVRMCDFSRPQRRCVNLEEACGIIIFDPDEGYRWEKNVFTRTEMMDTVFPYAFRQQQLNADFRVQSSSCEYRDTSPRPSPSGQPTPSQPPEGIEIENNLEF